MLLYAVFRWLMFLFRQPGFDRPGAPWDGRVEPLSRTNEATPHLSQRRGQVKGI
jgi:hypothetical protein